MILLLIIINLFNQISFLFVPIYTMAKMLLIPFAAAGFFYYLLRPLVHLWERRGMKRKEATLLIYVVLTAFTALLMIGLGPMLQSQLNLFLENVPELLEALRVQLEHFEENRFLAAFFPSDSFDLTAKVSDWVNRSITLATNYVTGLISLVTSTLLILTAIPVILYYWLTEGHYAKQALLDWLPERVNSVAEELLTEIDSVLGEFTIGRIVVCLVVGVMVYAGFLLIGLPYPMLLALFAMVMNLIPLIGPMIGTIPSFIVAFTESSVMAVWVIVIVVVAKLADNILVSPQVFSNRMDLHPLTVLLLLIISAEAAGILGMIFVIPVYMVVKIMWLRFRPRLST
nr:AI-2E family transporter [Paenibacillus sp. PvP091]